MEDFYEYIKKLPEPLSKDKQHELLEIYYDTYDEDVRDELILHNLRLAVSCVLKYSMNAYDLDDLMQEATLELMHVLDNKYDISRGVEFSTFAYSCIKGKLRNVARLKEKSCDLLNRDELKVDYIRSEKDGEKIDVLDIVPSEDKFVEEVAYEDRLYRFLQSLSVQDRYILMHRTGIFDLPIYTREEIAEKIGCNIQYVFHHEEKIFAKLRNFYLNDGKLFENDVENKISK